MAIESILGGLTTGLASGFMLAREIKRRKQDRELANAMRDLSTKTVPGPGGGVEEEEQRKAYAGPGGRKGGKISRTGPYKLHRGELVVPAKLAARLGKVSREGSERAPMRAGSKPNRSARRSSRY